MKVFLVALVLVFAVQAGTVREGICKYDAAIKLDIDGLISTMKSQAKPYLKACTGLNDALFNPANGCVKLIQQGYCYYKVAAERYPEGGLSYEEVKTGFPDVAKLAGYGCANTCFDNIAPIVKGCYADEEVKEEILKHVSAGFDKLRGFLVKNKGSVDDTPLASVLSMGLSKYSDFSDVRAMVVRNSDKIKEAYFSIKEQMQTFCGAGCVAKTKKWGVQLLDGIAQGSCTDPKVFCGECADNAAAALTDRKPRMPCCMIKLYSYFSDRADQAAELAKTAGSDIGVELATILESGETGFDRADRGIKQYNCVKSVFDDYVDTRSCA